MTTDTQGQSRRRRRRLILILLAGALVLAGVLLVAGVLLGRRQLAGAVVRRQLRALGAEGLEFDIGVLGTGETQLTDLRLPGGAGSAASVAVSYSLGDLAELRLKTAAVRGIDLPIRRDADGWSIPLATWFQQLRLPPPDPATPASFHVTVPSATVDAVIRVVHHRLGEWRLPARADLQVSPERLQGSAGLQLLGDEQRVKIDLTPELDGEVRFTGRLANLAAFHTLCRYADLSLPCELLPGGEGATVEVAILLRKGQPASVSATATFAAARLRWQGREFTAGALRLTARSASPDLSTWEVTGTAAGLGGFGTVIPELAFALSGDADAGTLTVRQAQFRRGNVAGTVTGEVRWTAGQHVDASLRIARLAVGELSVEGATLAAKGTRSALDWALAWDGESGVFGLRSVALAGRASLAGGANTTLGGKATLSLGALAEFLGLPDCTGELSLNLTAGATVHLANGGVDWQGKLDVACPDLAVGIAETRAGVSGLQVALVGKGNSTTADLSVRVESLSGFVERAGARVATTGNRVQLEAKRVALADALALVRQPLRALPKTSQAVLAVELRAGTLATDLGQWATRLGKEEQFVGKLTVREFQAKADWTAKGVTLKTSALGACPDLALAFPGDLRLALPTAFELSLSGTPEGIDGSLSCKGEGVAVTRGEATAKAGAWQGDVTLAGLPLAEFPDLPARLSSGQSLPAGRQLRLATTLAEVSCDLAPWGPLSPPASLAGRVELRSAGLALVLDDAGLSGEASFSGQGRGLQTGSPKMGAVKADADVSASIKGSPTGLSGSVDLALISPRWQREKIAFTADRARTTVSGVDLPVALAGSLLRDPLHTLDAESAAKVSVSLALNGGVLTGLPGVSLTGLSLTGNAVHWTARAGWQTGKDGVHLQLADVTAQGIHVQQATGDLGLAGTDFQLTADLPLIGPGVTARIEAKGELAPRLSLRGTLTVPEFLMSTDQGWVLGMVNLGGIGFSTRVGAAVDFALGKGEPALGIRLGVREGRLTLPESAGEVTGVETELELAILPETRSKPHQKLTIAGARVANLAFGKGEVFYRIDGPRLLFLESVLLGWCKGELEAHALRFDAGKTDLEGTVYARGIDVGEFVQLFPNIEGTGQGNLYGRLPVFRRKGQLGYGEGFLYSIPGEHGFLQIGKPGNPQTAVARMAGKGDIVRDSLRDFEYSLFRVDIKPKGHQQEGIRIRLVGAKAGQKDAQPVDLNVNINGAIEEALNLGVKVGGIKQIFESVGGLQRALQKFIE